jgi:ferric-dicitrate binding protein FerR (iron transport regulator)
MDAADTLVAVLTSAAVGWLVWVEVRSRRNTATGNAQQLSEPDETTVNLDAGIILDKRATRKKQR